MAEVIASYSELNQDSELTPSWQSTVFLSSQENVLNSCSFLLRKTGTPVGNATAYLYPHSTNVITSGKPTGSPITTSNSIVETTLTTVLALVTFYFPDGIILAKDGVYDIVIKTSGDFTNGARIGNDTSRPTYPGVRAWSNDGITWTQDFSNKLCFYVFNNIIPPALTPWGFLNGIEIKAPSKFKEEEVVTGSYNINIKGKSSRFIKGIKKIWSLTYDLLTNDQYNTLYTEFTKCVTSSPGYALFEITETNMSVKQERVFIEVSSRVFTPGTDYLSSLELRLIQV